MASAPSETLSKEKTEHTFFFLKDPWSKVADPDQLEVGDFIEKNADLVASMVKQLPEFRRLVGRSGPEIKMSYFKNWGGTQNGLLFYSKPKTTAEVIKLVKAAAEMNKPSDTALVKKIAVGFGGSYHSWSPLFPDPGGLLINMTELQLDFPGPGGKPFRLNPEKTEVTISPGVTCVELMEFFLAKGVCFKSETIIANVTYGGTLLTGCHGVGRDQKAMADGITSLKLVNAKGECNVYSYDSDREKLNGLTHDEVMNTLRVPLGLCGAVVEMTVKVDPVEKYRVKNIFSKTVGDVFYGDSPQIKHLVEKEYWSVEIFWFPFNSMRMKDILNLDFSNWHPKNDHLWIRGINKLGPGEHDETNFDKKMMKWRSLFDAFQTDIRAMYPTIAAANPWRDDFDPVALKPLLPCLVHTNLKSMKGNYLTKDSVLKLPYAIHYLDAIDRSFVQNMEFALPVDADYKNIRDAVETVCRLTEEEARKNKFPLDLLLEMRFIGKSDCFLCPAAYSGDNKQTMYIEILSLKNAEGYKDFYRKVAGEWMKNKGSIPHLAKEWAFIGEDIYKHIRTEFGSNIPTFLKVRDKLGVDPNDMFMNSTLKKLLIDQL